MAEIVLYHGSDNNFESFDESKISKGEGGDLFGRGYYLTNNIDVASHYAHQVALSRFVESYKPTGIFGSFEPVYKTNADEQAKQYECVNTFKIKDANILDARTFIIDNPLRDFITDVLIKYLDFDKDGLDRQFNFLKTNKENIKNYRGELEYVFSNMIAGNDEVRNLIVAHIQSQGYDGVLYESDKRYEGQGSLNYVIYNRDVIHQYKELTHNQSNTDDMDTNKTDFNNIKLDNINCQYFVRLSDHIQDDLKRGWSSFNFGAGGVEADSSDKIYDELVFLKENERMFSISGFDIYLDSETKITKTSDEIIIVSGADKTRIRELYPNYWVVIDDINAKGGLSAHELPNNFSDLVDLVKEVSSKIYKYDGTGNGQSFPASDSKVIYSNRSIHILEVGKNEIQKAFNNEESNKDDNNKIKYSDVEYYNNQSNNNLNQTKMEYKKIATAELKQTQEKEPIFNLGFFKNEVDALSTEKYINTTLVSTKELPEKLFLIQRPEKGSDVLKDFNVYGSISLYGDKVKELHENNGYYNIAAMPLLPKEGQVLTAEEKNTLVVFQTTGKDAEKHTNYVGTGMGYTPKSLGLGFQNEVKGQDIAFINASLDKVKLLFTPDNEYKNIVIGIKDAGETKTGVKMGSFYPTTTSDKDALIIVEIEKGKLLDLPTDGKGNIKVTIAEKNEAHIQKDKANINVYQTQSEADKDQPKNYVGKGWDRVKQAEQKEQKKNSDLAM